MLLAKRLPGGDSFFPACSRPFTIIWVYNGYPAIIICPFSSLPSEIAPGDRIRQMALSIRNPVNLPGCLRKYAEA